MNLYASLPAFAYNGNAYNGGKLQMHTTGDTLKVNAQIQKGLAGENGIELHVNAAATDNTLKAML